MNYKETYERYYNLSSSTTKDELWMFITDCIKESYTDGLQKGSEIATSHYKNLCDELIKQINKRI